MKQDEEAFQKDVISVARAHGWKVHHSRKTRIVRQDGSVLYRTPLSGDKGYVDLTLAKDGVVLHVELKTETGSLSDEQQGWRDAIGSTHRVWRPRDWHAEIVPLLSDGQAKAAPHSQYLLHQHGRK